MQHNSPELLRHIEPGLLRDAIIVIQATAFPECPPHEIEQTIETVHALFSGKNGRFQASDTAYHNFTHSLQVTLCWSQMLTTLVEYHPEHPISVDAFMAGIAACLLHDSGYLKEKGDPEGTGAKYVLVHEHRSCLISRQFLQDLEWTSERIEMTSRLIAATGPRAVIDGIPFPSNAERMLARMLGTADFLAQMADPQYVEKLPSLYAEFQEFDRFRGIQPDERIFPSFESLLSGTPDFWSKLVIPRLENDYAKVYELLNAPYPSGPNLYMRQAENNIRALQANQLA
jgi:hypothetical protein